MTREQEKDLTLRGVRKTYDMIYQKYNETNPEDNDYEKGQAHALKYALELLAIDLFTR